MNLRTIRILAPCILVSDRFLYAWAIAVRFAKCNFFFCAAWESFLAATTFFTIHWLRLLSRSWCLYHRWSMSDGLSWHWSELSLSLAGHCLVVFWESICYAPPPKNACHEHPAASSSNLSERVKNFCLWWKAPDANFEIAALFASC